MKKLLISAAFLAMLASPALAQSYTPEFGGANVLNVPRAEHNGSESYARSFGFSSRHWDHARTSRGADARAETTGNGSYAGRFGFSAPNADEDY